MNAVYVDRSNGFTGLLSSPHIIASSCATSDISRASYDVLQCEFDHEGFALMVEVTVMPYIASLASQSVSDL